MLQALGLNQRSLDPQTREWRQRLFWHLNLLDKGFAIIFGRNPTFNRAMQRQIGVPKLGRLQYIRSHENSSGTPMVFGANFMHQKILLSYLMGDIWHCLYEEERPNDDSIKSLYKDLLSWYNEAKRLLDAAAVSEKPFCNTKNAKSIDIALCAMEFHFLYLSILLTRSSPDMEQEFLQNSKQILNLLPSMSVKAKEPYHQIIWQLVCCPLTTLLILLCDTVSNSTRSLEEKKENPAAMELFPGYLKDLSQRDSLARRLEGIARVFVRHARSAIDFQTAANSSILSPGVQRSAAFSEDPPWSLYDETLCASVFGSNGDGSIPTVFSMRSDNYDTDIVNDLTALQSSFDVCGDRLFDWLTWDTGN
ncbi:hypothetical protein N7493_008048 [Penicillium malachiteum]|uniref:Xylanolytic transcriptional activator regulatory domain-containing protein n=1 Tax=Penicillium malachiteum TaxID=1324776 RepID=A0AAD6HGG1_9EURO|nr:hypothetical protein N7493_008048 [Penicillium malachiteum]